MIPNSVKLILATLCLLIAFAGGYSVRATKAEAEVAALELKHAKARERQAAELAATVAEYRAKEASATLAIQKAQDAAHAQLVQAHADAAASRAAADRLQNRVAALVAAQRAAAPAGAAAAGVGPPAHAPVDLLADMLRRLDAAAGELGEYADRARIAGLACERAHDAVSDPGGPQQLSGLRAGALSAPLAEGSRGVSAATAFPHGPVPPPLIW